MDTKLSVAIHVLTLISESPEPMSSADMATSVGTNASYIRKVLSLLRRGEIIESRQGAAGYTLCVAPEKLSLLRIFHAVEEGADPHVLDIHQNPSDECLVGRNIRPVLQDVFGEAENAFLQALQSKTLGDVMDGIRSRLREQAS